jgi:hypothetical protein
MTSIRVLFAFGLVLLASTAAQAASPGAGCPGGQAGESDQLDA